MSASSRGIDRLEAIFDHDGIVANAGLVLPAMLMVRLGLEALIDGWVKTGSARPGRKVLTLVAAMIAGATHIDHCDMLRAGATQQVLPFKVMAPSTIGTFLRTFTYGHVRHLDAVLSRTLARAWRPGAGPGDGALTLDLDSTICEVHGRRKHGAAYGYTRQLGPEDAWVDIDYTLGGQAQVSETVLTIGRKQTKRDIKQARLIVRRTRLTNTTQARLWPDWRHHSFITNTGLDPVEADQFHREHAVVELAIRDLKEGAGIEHFPSGNFSANAAWLGCAVLAHNIGIWTSLLAKQPAVTNRTRRTQLIALAAVIVNRSGRWTLRLPTQGPWAHNFNTTLSALRALPAPSG